MSDWNGDDWLQNRQCTEDALTKGQKICKWMLDKTYPLIFISVGVSVATESFYPFVVAACLELSAVMYLLMKR